MKEKYLKPSNIKNFKITNSICTDTASFYIGDKIYLEKKRKEYNKLYISGNNQKQDTFQFDTTNEGTIYDQYSSFSKLPNMFSSDLLDRKKSLNLNLSFFSLVLTQDTCIPIYFFEFNKELDSFFVPLIFPGMETYINDNMDLWNEKNISLKKSIINQFSEEKSKWIKIGKLNIPSKKLLTQEGHFISTGKMWELEHEIYKSKEEYDIFAIYSDKEDLYKIYNNPDLSNLDLDDRRFETDASGEYVPKNNPINFEEKILYGLFFKSKK